MHAYATYRNIFIEKKKTAIRPPKTSKELDHLINNASEKIAEYEAMSILTMAGIQTQRGFPCSLTGRSNYSGKKYSKAGSIENPVTRYTP